MPLHKVLSLLNIDFRIFLIVTLPKNHCNEFKTQFKQIGNGTVVYESLFLKPHSCSCDSWLRHTKFLSKLPVAPPAILYKFRNQSKLNVLQPISSDSSIKYLTRTQFP